MIQIREIAIAGKKQREAFLKLPFQLARQHPEWIPGLRLQHRQLLNPAKNPFLKEVQLHFFLAEENQKIAGRIALFGPGHWKNDPQVATIGFFDFENNTAVGQQLLATAEAKAKALGATRILGPLNPNIHYDVGLLTQGFDLSNAAFMGYNPPFYAAALELAGWKVCQTFQSWSLTKSDFQPDAAFNKISNRAMANSSLKLRSINPQKFKDELAIFYDLYCKSFENHWGFTAPSRAEFDFIAGDLRYLLKPEMGMVAEWQGRPIGFVLGIPDLYQLLKKDRSGNIFPLNWYRLATGLKKLKTMRVMIAGLLPAFQGSGIFAALFRNFTETLFTSGGIESGEIGWVMKGNASMERTLLGMGAIPVKEYTLFEKKLNHGS